MVDKPTTSDKKTHFQASNGLLTTPAQIAFKKTHIGPVGLYFHSKLVDMSRDVEKFRNYENEKAFLEQQRDSKELSAQILAEAENGDYESAIPNGSALEKRMSLDIEIENLKKPLPLPRPERLHEISQFSHNTDVMLNDIATKIHNLRNLDKLSPATQNYFCNMLEQMHYEEHVAQLDREYDAAQAKKQAAEGVFPDSCLVDSSSKTDSAKIPSEELIQNALSSSQVEAMKSEAAKLAKLNDPIYMKGILSYKKLERGSQEFAEFVERKCEAFEESAKNTEKWATQMVDLGRGVYPQGLLSDSQIPDSTEIWGNFAGRTALNAGVALAGSKASEKTFELVKNTPWAKATVNAAVGAAEKTALTALAARTMIPIADLAALRPLMSMSLAGSSLGAGTFKVMGGLGAIAGETFVETPIELAVDSLFDTHNNGSHIEAPLFEKPTHDEVQEMGEKEVFKNTDYLTRASCWIMSYDNYLLSQPELFVQGKPIPSMCVSADRLQDMVNEYERQQKHQPLATTKKHVTQMYPLEALDYLTKRYDLLQGIAEETVQKYINRIKENDKAEPKEQAAATPIAATAIPVAHNPSNGTIRGAN